MTLYIQQDQKGKQDAIGGAAAEAIVEIINAAAVLNRARGIVSVKFVVKDGRCMSYFDLFPAPMGAEM